MGKSQETFKKKELEKQRLRARQDKADKMRSAKPTRKKVKAWKI